jgi:poly(3-hydroxybutyrate) depolymerase
MSSKRSTPERAPASRGDGLHREWICLAAFAAALVAALSPASARTASLPSFNVDVSQVTVSGLSSGGFMAVQFDIAYSASIKGAGIIAGGPFDCAQGDLQTATSVCSCTGFFGCIGSTDTQLSDLIRITDQDAQQGQIDPTSNLARQRIWMLSGTADTIVPQRVMNDLASYYTHYIDAANIAYRRDLDAQHAMPTDSFGSTCQALGDPYINNCRFDAAGELLSWLYATLKPKNPGQLRGSLIQFDQSEFVSDPQSHDLDGTGWVYVPADCANRQVCKLHVVFHGCQQYQSRQYVSPDQRLVTFGTTYVQHAGYNEWADTNDIIVLYPQATADLFRNPNGCWDWWGYDDADYAIKSGTQMAAVKAMIDRISGNATGSPTTASIKHHVGRSR